jgi:tRNA threonylcarbamoyladenosine biosynthesis protein TsaE
MVKSYLTTSSSQTKKLGENLAKEILKTKSKKKAVIVGLEGELGSGKTTFLQGFAKGLGIKEKILSPTFIIMKRFRIKVSSFKNFYHIDCYRISKPKEILNLGFKKIISNPKNIIAIEWADQIKEILPKNTLILKFKFIEKTKRKIKYRTNCRG